MAAKPETALPFAAEEQRAGMTLFMHPHAHRHALPILPARPEETRGNNLALYINLDIIKS
jgi:hypothetical protein